MTGSLLATTWEGHRNEAFAAYALSGVASVIKVPREADVGFDLLCTLLHYDEPSKLLYAGKSFGIQIKSAAEKEIPYGGIDTKKKKSKQYEIDWLFQQEQPLLIGLVSLKGNSLYLYSTQRIWQVFNQTKNPGKVKLLPNIEPKRDADSTERFKARKLRTGDLEAGDGFSYEVPLGKPIVCIEIEKFKEDYENLRIEIINKINQAIEIDYRNIANRNFNIPISEERDGWEGKYNNSYIYHLADKEKIQSMLRSIAPVISSLMINEHNLPNPEELKKVVEFAELLKEHKCLGLEGIILMENILKTKSL